MYQAKVLALAVLSVFISAPLAAAQPSKPPAAAALVGDAVRGEKLYTSRCTACHSLDANRIGPSHRGVVGRQSGKVAGFKYTPALQKLNVVWTPANLDRWLTNPGAMAPGTSMALRVPVAQDRADLIAYMSAQK